MVCLWVSVTCHWSFLVGSNARAKKRRWYAFGAEPFVEPFVSWIEDDVGRIDMIRQEIPQEMWDKVSSGLSSSVGEKTENLVMFMFV